MNASDKTSDKTMDRNGPDAENPADIAAERKPFDEGESTRFRNLLTLAAQSPFEGERVAALSAATRMANRHGMSLDDAAAGGADPEPVAKPIRPRQASGMARGAGRSVHLMDVWVASDKARHEAALAEARSRGLDAEKNRATPVRPPRRFGSRRNPLSHAQVLLAETSMPLSEIASLTGLDMYKLVALKLKMRAADRANA